MILKEISYHYRKNLILHNFSFDFSEKGKAYLLIGKNGSGKSTLLKIMTGLIKNYNGKIEYDKTEKIRSCLDFTGFDPDISGLHNIFNVLAIESKIDNYYLYKIIELFAMRPFITKKYKKMSLGMQQKTSIIAALASNPDFLIFDEPLNGLDKYSCKILIKLLMDDFILHNKKVLISSHADEEIIKFIHPVEIIDFNEVPA